ncbi:hypothetical protein AB0305_03720 [Arthrobacter sp. NPDC080086]|uniref:hypothetical protein n=1 Tax=Arthrobacter sp. NPDC080086 TaxID=3155917 RepID=UPI00344DF172
MIYLIEQKPGEAMSFAGRFRLTGVVMVDPHDNKTMQLPFLVRKARVRFCDFFVHRELAEALNPALLPMVNRQGALFLMQLGGLASPW